MKRSEAEIRKILNISFLLMRKKILLLNTWNNFAPLTIIIIQLRLKMHPT